MKEFLTADWWVGVQGIVGTIALAAVAIAAIDLVIRLNLSSINAMGFTVTTVKRYGKTAEVTVAARTMGPTVLYEPEWRIFGMELPFDDDLPPVLESRDDEVTITISIPYEKLESVWVGIAWVEPRRLGSRACASRVSLRGNRYQRWETYRWYWWPRKNVGRWVENRVAKRGSLLEIPSD